MIPHHGHHEPPTDPTESTTDTMTKLTALNAILAPKTAKTSAPKTDRAAKAVEAVIALSNGTIEVHRYSHKDRKGFRKTKPMNPAETISTILRALKYGATADDVLAMAEANGQPAIAKRFPWICAATQISDVTPAEHNASMARILGIGQAEPVVAPEPIAEPEPVVAPEPESIDAQANRIAADAANAMRAKAARGKRARKAA